MTGKIFTSKLLSAVLGSALLIGLLPMSNHMSFMQTMSIDAATASQSHIVQGNVGDTSPRSCCDAIGPLSPACDFVISQSGYVAQYGGNERVEDTAPIVQSIYIETIAPPPKT